MLPKGNSTNSDKLHLVADHILPPVVQSGLQVTQLVPEGGQLLLQSPALLPDLPYLSFMLPAQSWHEAAAGTAFKAESKALWCKNCIEQALQPPLLALQTLSSLYGMSGMSRLVCACQF